VKKYKAWAKNDFYKYDKENKQYITKWHMVDVQIMYVNKDKIRGGWVTEEGKNYREFTEFKILETTGLNDKNGLPIYEGDIINGCEVYWSSQWAMFSVKGEGIGALIRFADDCEIQGNIYENPELIK
jgi:hypothetical protein